MEKVSGKAESQPVVKEMSPVLQMRQHLMEIRNLSLQMPSSETLGALLEYVFQAERMTVQLELEESTA